MVDEIPMLACLATRAEGETVITGAGELRVKESDRIAAVVTNLRALGAHADELADGMRILGSDAPLTGRVVTHGDHRLAMAFGVLGAAHGNSIEVDDRDCVAVSYPGFWSDLARPTRHEPALFRDRDRRTGGVGQVVDGAAGRAPARVSPRRFGVALPRGDGGAAR